LFAQTQHGARASANLYSLVSCARVNGLELYAYLRYLFEELPKASTAEALEALLPWNVKPVLQVHSATVKFKGWRFYAKTGNHGVTRRVMHTSGRQGSFA